MSREGRDLVLKDRIVGLFEAVVFEQQARVLTMIREALEEERVRVTREVSDASLTEALDALQAIVPIAEFALRDDPFVLKARDVLKRAGRLK